MITILGDANERVLVEELCDLLATELPGIRESGKSEILACVGAKCPGSAVRDIDLLLIIELERPVRVSLAEDVAVPGMPAQVLLKSLAMVVEIKSHDATGVRFQGSEVEVSYRHEWHNASRQNNQQVHSLRAYLTNRHIQTFPFFCECVWLTGLVPADLPPRPHALMSRQVTLARLCAAALATAKTTPLAGHPAIMTHQQPFAAMARKVFAGGRTPSGLDRRKIDAIAKRHLDPILVPGPGGLVLRGRGGTGKTIGLLQYAHKTCVERGDRVLVLTYNAALVSEIERLLICMGISDALDAPSISVRTVHGLIDDLSKAAGIPEVSVGSTGEGGAHPSAEALYAMAKDGDLATMLRSECGLGRWDWVCVDEAQDMAPSEKNIIHAIFGASRCVVADGVDQVVRGNTGCAWRTDGTTVQPLTVSLRQKGGLCDFANTLAQELGIPWEIKSNPAMPGGSVILLLGGDPCPATLLREVADANRQAGNQPIDMLFCVGPEPRAAVRVTEEVARIGLKLWNGVDHGIRRVPPWDLDQVRMVSHESCRGLEGWVTWCTTLDLQLAFREHIHLEQGSSAVAAIDLAMKWLMIPMTRAIDTLVIHVEDPGSLFGRALQTAVSRWPDHCRVFQGT